MTTQKPAVHPSRVAFVITVLDPAVAGIAVVAQVALRFSGAARCRTVVPGEVDRGRGLRIAQVMASGASRRAVGSAA